MAVFTNILYIFHKEYYVICIGMNLNKCVMHPQVNSSFFPTIYSLWTHLRTKMLITSLLDLLIACVVAHCQAKSTEFQMILITLVIRTLFHIFGHIFRCMQ